MKLSTTKILSNLQGTIQRGGLDNVEYGFKTSLNRKQNAKISYFAYKI